MHINFLCNVVAGGWEPTDIRLGGTEDSIKQWAEILAHRGNEVTVYRNGRDVPPPTREGDDVSWVSYRPRELYEGDGAVCINVKSSEIAPKEPTLYFTNETNASSLDLKAYRAVLWPSQWCIDNIPVNNPTTLVVPHGYDPTLIYPEAKIPQQCLYASSPDRGLDTLLDAWPQVHQAHPHATLLVTYGGEPIDLPNVMTLGNVSEVMMAELYRTSDIWCHPASGGELFCITGKKAQAAGCIPVIIPTMALAETVERGFKTDKEHYAQTLSEVLAMRPEYRDHIRQDVIAHANALTWEQSTDVLMAAIERVL